MANAQNNYYSNPAFCQQSEYYNAQLRCRSPPRVTSPTNSPKSVSPFNGHSNIRQSPVGAQAKMRVLDTSLSSIQDEVLPPKPAKYIHKEDYEEQGFYEEMIVDDCGLVKEKKFVIVSSQPERNGNIPQTQSSSTRNHRYEYIGDSKGGICGTIPTKQQQQQNRYEYIPMQSQEEMHNGRVHRYAVITDDEDLANTNGRYAIVPVQERYAVVPQNNVNRYEYIQTPIRTEQVIRTVVSPQPQRKANPLATQKLHELLTTPKKTQAQNPQTPQRIRRSQYLRSSAPIHREAYVSPNNSPPKIVRPNTRVQQKLNYALGTRQMAQDKRYTAIVAPICSNPVQSVYSETTFSQKSDSWKNLSSAKPPLQLTLAVAAVMMVSCGGVSTGLCFYMIWILGRQYFLDFGIVAAFTCFVLGLLGFRTRHCYWLPNRNYISGYIVLSVFSLLTCAGLLVLLFMRPKPGTPLADITSGAVCGISALSLFLATVGVVSSYCCHRPPPDNRVQHYATGFSL